MPVTVTQAPQRRHGPADTGALGTTDAVLQLFYNAATITGLLVPFAYLARHRPEASMRSPRTRSRS